MKRLRLDLETLEVDSFDTQSVAGRGTVRGAQTNGYALDASCEPETCGGGGYEPTVLTCDGETCPKSGCAGMPTCGPTLRNTCLSCHADRSAEA